MEDVLNNPIAVKCEKQWQKGFLLGFFKRCDNPFRIEDEGFCYAHFRSNESFTFYKDEYGVENEARPVFKFEEIFQKYAGIQS